MALLAHVVALDEHYSLAHDIACRIGAHIHIPKITQFADGEFEVELWQEFLWQDQHVIIIAPTAHHMHSTIIKIFFLVHVLKQRGVKKCTWVAPYCAYSRQCQDSSGTYRGHMAAIACMAESVGIDEFIIIEPHDHAITSLFSIPVHVVSMHEDIVQALRNQTIALDETCIVAPDQGAVSRAQLVAQTLQVPLVNVVKERFDTDQSRVLGVHGYTGFKKAIIVDDIFDTGRTAFAVAQVLFDLGVEEIHGIFVHGIFSCGVQEIASTSWYQTIQCSPTVWLPELDLHGTLSVFSIPHTITAVARIIQTIT